LSNARVISSLTDDSFTPSILLLVDYPSVSFQRTKLKESVLNLESVETEQPAFQEPTNKDA